VTAPREEDRLAALAALSGSGALTLPEPGPERAVLAAELVGRARRKGATWAALGEILGVPGPTLAKREARLIARAVAAGRPYPLTRP
jgi:hypothetical protein